MFVIFRDKNNTVVVRPAYIGFIKNDAVRRCLGLLIAPVTLILIILLGLLSSLRFFVLNVLATILNLFFDVFNAIYRPITGCKPMWKAKIWDQPNDDANKVDVKVVVKRMIDGFKKSTTDSVSEVFEVMMSLAMNTANKSTKESVDRATGVADKVASELVVNNSDATGNNLTMMLFMA